MFKNKLRALKKATTKLCHGIITGAADNDPAGISTYSIVGATTGFAQLWLVPFSTVLLIAVQAICAKIGDVKKIGLAAIIKEGFGKDIAFLAMIFLILANLTTMGADFAAIGAAFSILFPKINIFFILPLVAIFIWYIVVFKSFRFISQFLLVLSLIFVSYIISGVMSKPDWGEIIHNTFIPRISFDRFYWIAAVGFLGTTISPYLFFWQVAEEAEDHPSVKDVPKEVKENAPGFIFSNLITYFIIISTATVLFTRGIPITNAADAALSLKPFLGNLAFSLFALGIIGSGLLALPVLAASTAYAVAEIFGWKEGLSRKPSAARGFYTVLSATFFIALSVALLKINPIKILFWSQVFTGILTPPLLGLIMVISGSERLMGKYKNGIWLNILGWLTVVVMMGAVIGILIS
jgi:Mn2+/Fe2+ NRAMP family transporter